MLRPYSAAALILAVSAAAAQPPAAPQAASRIEAISRQLSALAADESRGGDTLSEGRGRLAALNAGEADLMARMGANQNQLSRMLGALQMYGANPPPALFIHPDDAKKAVRAAILVRAVMPQLQQRAKAYAAQADQAVRVRRQAASASESLFTTESEMADRASRIEQLIAEKQTLQQSLGQAPPAEPDVPALAARVQTLRASPAAVDAPAEAVLKAAPGKLTPPVPGAPSRRFGQASPSGGQIEGWTWTPPPGAAVVAPGAGRVEYAGPVRGWDNVLIIDIGGGHHLVLAGARTLLAAAGQSVTAGQTVARMPPSADAKTASVAAQLYLEVRKGGEPVDPARFFAAIGQ